MYENINQEHNLLPEYTFEPFTYVCCENCMPGFSAFVLNLSKSGNILFRSMPNGNCLFSSASLSLVREITHWCMYSDGSWQVICKCNIWPTSVLKSLYGKSQSVIGKSYFSWLFFFVWTSTGTDSTKSDLNCSWVIKHQMVQNFWGLDMTHLKIR